MSNSANQRQANRIEKLKKFIMQHLFEDNLTDDPFFFNLKYNEDGDLVLGDGSDKEHMF